MTRMAISEAEKLLVSLSGVDINVGNSKPVTDILERLDRLPLVITQAALYMRETYTG